MATINDISNPSLWYLFLRSVSIILGVAIVFGLGVGYITQRWITGVFAFFLTIFAQFIINNIFRNQAIKKNQEAEFLAEQVLREATERQMPFTLNCAYCNSTNRVGISFNSENIFNCASCQQPNKVYIQFTTVRITTPLIPKENNTFIDLEPDSGVSQTTINQPIKLNEK